MALQLRFISRFGQSGGIQVTLLTPFEKSFTADDLMVRGIHPPIVSQEPFDAVQGVLTGRSKTAQSRQGAESSFPATSIHTLCKVQQGPDCRYS